MDVSENSDVWNIFYKKRSAITGDVYNKLMTGVQEALLAASRTPLQNKSFKIFKIVEVGETK